MRKALLVVCLIAIVLLFGSSIVLAADIVVGVQKPAVIQSNSGFILQVSLTNDKVIKGLQIPISFFHNTNNDVRCDSIQWTSRVTDIHPLMYAGQDGDVSYLHNASETMAVVVWAVLTDKGLPPGEGPICNLYFSTGSNWVKEVGLKIDLTDQLTPGPAEVSGEDGHAFPVAFKVNEGGGNSGDVGGSALPAEFSLKQNYPNPFNPATTIEFNLPKAGQVTVYIYNTRGQEVKSFQRYCSPGTVTIVWNGEDNRGNPVASGTYFYRVSAPDGKTFAKKMVLVK